MREFSSQSTAQQGFTLIELLVAIAIVGVLAVIAVPQYSAYRTRAFDARAQESLRNAVTAQEAAFADRERYWDCMNRGCNDPALPGFQLSEGLSIACTPRNDGQMYRCSVIHGRGTRTFYYDSENSVFWEM